VSEATHIVCPQCSSVNRVPVARLGDRPVCGRCKAKLFAGHPVELTAANFETQVGRSGLPVLVDFWAPWCGPCRTMAPVFVEAAGLLEPRVRLAKLDTEAEGALAARYRVQSIPTLALFRGGREVARQAGAMPLQALLGWVRSQLG